VSTLHADGFQITLARGWVDVTADIEGDPPLTLAKPDGVGAFQLSAAIHERGPEPGASPGDLRELLMDFARKHALGTASEIESRASGDSSCVGASFQARDEFTRAWYVSNGRDFVLATYTCDADAGWRDEVADCEAMIGTVQLGAA
jgi:hypothetical protein